MMMPGRLNLWGLSLDKSETFRNIVNFSSWREARICIADYQDQDRMGQKQELAS